jgi:hypothetical protein
MHVHRLVALMMTGAALAIGSPAYAWQDEEPVTDASPPPQLIVEPDGTATLLWGEANRGTIAASKKPGQRLGTPEPIGGTFTPVASAIDSHGTIHVLVNIFPPTSSGVNSRLGLVSRPAAGDWSAPEAIPETDNAAGWLAVNRDGDVGVLIRRRDEPGRSGNYYAAFQPRGGEVGQPLYIAPVPDDLRHETAALTSDGTLIGLYEIKSLPSGWPQQVYAISRTATEPAEAPQLLSSPKQWGYSPKLAVDDRGRAVAVWTEDQRGWEVPDWGDTRAYMATRLRGGPFGERTVVPTMNGWVNRVAMGPDGRITIAALGNEVDILSAPFGEPLTAEKHANVQYMSPVITLASSPGGRTVFSWSPDDEHALAMVGDADGHQGPMRDVLRSCGDIPGYTHRVGAVNDNGYAAIIYRERTSAQLSLVTHNPADPAPANECIDHPPFYGRDMEPPAKPWTPPVPPPSPWSGDHPVPIPPEQETPPGSPPVELPASGDPRPPAADPGPIGQFLPPSPPASAPPLRPTRGSARMGPDGKTVVARVVVSCPATCSLQVKPTLDLGRGWRLSGRVKRARLPRGGGPVTIKWKLPTAARRMVRQRRSAARATAVPASAHSAP